MTFRVVCFESEEIRAELKDLKQALKLCDQLAQEGGYKENWAVLQLVTIYQTKTGQSDD